MIRLAEAINAFNDISMETAVCITDKTVPKGAYFTSCAAISAWFSLSLPYSRFIISLAKTNSPAAAGSAIISVSFNANSACALSAGRLPLHCRRYRGMDETATADVITAGKPIRELTGPQQTVKF